MNKLVALNCNNLQSLLFDESRLAKAIEEVKGDDAEEVGEWLRAIPVRMMAWFLIFSCFFSNPAHFLHSSPGQKIKKFRISDCSVKIVWG